MKKFHSEGGRPDPGYRYKVRISHPTDEMIHWCNAYPDANEFPKYYINWLSSMEDNLFYNQAVFSFETETPYIMFVLKYA
jgi:hypothetical protein